jgi:hypothetical protein
MIPQNHALHHVLAGSLGAPPPPEVRHKSTTLKIRVLQQTTTADAQPLLQLSNHGWSIRAVCMTRMVASFRLHHVQSSGMHSKVWAVAAWKLVCQVMIVPCTYAINSSMVATIERLQQAVDCQQRFIS